MTLEIDLQARVNATYQNVVFYQTIDQVWADNIKVTSGVSTGDVEQAITQAILGHVGYLNDTYSKGWSIANINPALGMVGGILKNMTMTPSVKDGYLYSGFSLQMDGNSATYIN